jgi:hypothetical protein
MTMLPQPPPALSARAGADLSSRPIEARDGRHGRSAGAADEGAAKGAAGREGCLIFAGMRGEDGGCTGAEHEMSLALLLALQAAAPAPAEPLAIDFDLAKLKPADPCRTGGGGSDIVVCGRRTRGDYDIEKWERVFRTGPLVAEKGIGPGAVVRAYVESVPMPGGQVSKRAMVGVKIKF